jgi:hypothetical protein
MLAISDRTTVGGNELIFFMGHLHAVPRECSQFIGYHFAVDISTPLGTSRSRGACKRASSPDAHNPNAAGTIFTGNGAWYKSTSDSATTDKSCVG